MLWLRFKNTTLDCIPYQEGYLNYFISESIDGCGMAGWKHDASKDGHIIARKRLTTARDCRYNCKFTTGCKTGLVDLAENTCTMYNAEAGTYLVLKSINLLVLKHFNHQI